MGRTKHKKRRGRPKSNKQQEKELRFLVEILTALDSAKENPEHKEEKLVKEHVIQEREMLFYQASKSSLFHVAICVNRCYH